MTSSPAQRIRGAGLRATASRAAVLEVLDRAAPAHRHLSAAEVITAVRERLDGASVQGVYDCLDALTAVGLARRIEPAGHPARYEVRVGDNHHHVVCRSCGATTDVDCVRDVAPCLHPSDAAGFVIDEAEITFWGLCPACAGTDREDRP